MNWHGLSRLLGASVIAFSLIAGGSAGAQTTSPDQNWVGAWAPRRRSRTAPR